MEIHFLLSGIVFGLSGGLSPGPLLTLVISETLRHGAGAGIRIALAPLFTDGPIIILILLVFRNLSEYGNILAVLTLCGSGFLMFLAWKNITFKVETAHSENLSLPTLTKGVIANLLNPSPYLFWAVVGGPLLLNARKISTLTAAAFLTGFYAMLLGTKILIAVTVEKSREFLKSKHYVYALRFLGLVLVFFSLKFFQEGIHWFYPEN
jgi:threonine/homoserine/homoserine lactone efflux protein